MLRLGAVLAAHAAIPDEVCEHAASVARDLREIAEREKVEQLFPVATAAIRDARNGRELADRIGRTLGTPVRVLSGKEEARLIYRAFRQRLHLDGERVLALDLGGGSLEIATGSNAEIEYEATLRLGVARLHRELVRSDPIEDVEAHAIRQRVRQALCPHAEAIAKLKPDRFVATGGTIRALARLVGEERARRNAPLENPGRLTRKRITRLCERLATSTHEERRTMRGRSRNRADLLPTGALILREVVKTLGAHPLSICDWGLREGVLLDSVL
jgi:exopolyphosphatase/guanosine-5'-triphosphate,3'-diphosphate pyrophosphatase